MAQVLSLDNKNGQNVTAAAEVFLEYGDFIRAVIHFNLPNPAEAHDFLHDFFLTLVANPIPANAIHIKRFLYRSIMYDILDHRRRRMIQKSALRNRVVYGRTAQPNNPDNVIMDREQLLRLFDLVESRLTRTEATAVTLRFREDYSTEEAARQMNIKPRTVSKYVYTGLEKLRRIVSHEEVHS